MGQWLTGDTIVEVGYVTRILRIPFDASEGRPESMPYLMAVDGALLELTKEYKWEQFGTATPEEVASLMATMFYEYLASEEMSIIGTILPYVTSVVPVNCLPCDGASYNQADYPLLYSAIDPIYRSGSTFVVPDFQGRFPLGVNGSHALNSNGGAETHTLTIGEIPAHTHDYLGASVPQANKITTGTAQAVQTRDTQTTQSTGGGNAHNNMPPFLAVKWCIVAS